MIEEEFILVNENPIYSRRLLVLFPPKSTSASNRRVRDEKLMLIILLWLPALRLGCRPCSATCRPRWCKLAGSYNCELFKHNCRCRDFLDILIGHFRRSARYKRVRLVKKYVWKQCNVLVGYVNENYNLIVILLACVPHSSLRYVSKPHKYWILSYSRSRSAFQDLHRITSNAILVCERRGCPYLLFLSTCAAHRMRLALTIDSWFSIWIRTILDSGTPPIYR